MAVYEPDSSATAVILCKLTDISYKWGIESFRLVSEYKVKIKVLKPEGTSYADVIIPYYELPNNAMKENIIGLDASAYNLENGKIVRTKMKKDEVFKIGIFNKPHGVKGEISFTFTDDIFDRVECEYLVCLLDGIFVPFFIEEYRFRSDTTALVKLEGVDTSEKARMFTNVEVYFPKKYVGEEEDSDDIPTWNYFIGFKVEDVNHGELGEIVAVDDSTMNVLFAIEKDGEELLLPAHEEFIIKLDKKKRLLTVEVPDGLI